MGRLIPAGTGLIMYRKLGIRAVTEGEEISFSELEEQETVEKKLDRQAVN